jgi:hypothetical protein
LHNWEKPPLGFLKCNVDAAISNNVAGMGAGFVLRDGTVLFFVIVFLSKCIKIIFFLFFKNYF